MALGPKSFACLRGHWTEEVFGIKRKEATAEQRRQMEFSRRQLQEITAQAAREDAEEGDVKEEDTEEGDAKEEDAEEGDAKGEDACSQQGRGGGEN